MTAILFVLSGLLLPWFSDGKHSYTLIQFAVSVQKAGGIGAFSRKEAGGDVLGVANLSLSYWSTILIVTIAVFLILRGIWILRGRTGRGFGAVATVLSFLYLCCFMIFGYYSYGLGLLLGMLVMLVDAVLGKFLDERQMLRQERLRTEDRERQVLEEKRAREAFPGHYGREFYRVILKNFRANLRDYLMFLAGASLTMLVLQIVWSMEARNGGVSLSATNALQLEIGTNLRQMLPVVMLLAVLLLSMIINSYVKTRMNNYSVYVALGIRGKTLIQIVALEYGVCILSAMLIGEIIGLLVYRGGTPSTLAILCYLGAVLLATLINYHLFEFKNIMRYNRSWANEKVHFGGTWTLISFGAFIMAFGVWRFAHRGGSENIFNFGILMLGFALLLYGWKAAMLRKRMGKLELNSEGVLAILPWRNRFQTNYLFRMLLVTLGVFLFGAFLPRLAMDKVPGEPNPGYDYVAMSYETDRQDVEMLREQAHAKVTEVPMVRVTTPLGANIGWVSADYGELLSPQGQHIGISESGYRKLCHMAGLEPEKLHLSADGQKVHVVIQQDASTPSHNLEWYLGGGGNMIRVGQPLATYNQVLASSTFRRHLATYERRVLTGILRGGTAENIVVFSDEYFQKVYRLPRVARDPEASVPPAEAKEGPSQLLLIRLGTDGRKNIEADFAKTKSILQRISDRHPADQEYDRSFLDYYKLSDTSSDNGKTEIFRHRMNQMVAAGLLLMTLFSFCIRLSLGRDEQQRQYRLLSTLGMDEKAQRRLYMKEIRGVIYGSLGGSLLLALPFDLLLPYLRMVQGEQLRIYSQNLWILNLGAAVLLAFTMELLGHHYRRSNR